MREAHGAVGLNSLSSETESDFGDQLFIYSLTRLGRSAEAVIRTVLALSNEHEAC